MSNTNEQKWRDIVEVFKPLRFKSKFVKRDSGCWEWIGLLNSKGYGVYNQSKNLVNQKLMAHRVSYFLAHGSLLSNLVVDHICKNRKCVNPLHLRQVTLAENTLNNSISTSAINKRKTHCIRGHELSPTNARVKTNYKNGKIYRSCIDCEKNRDKLRWKNGMFKNHKNRRIVL